MCPVVLKNITNQKSVLIWIWQYQPHKYCIEFKKYVIAHH